MEEYSGAYMRLLHNVFRVDRASLVLASDTRTALVALLRDLTRSTHYAYTSTSGASPAPDAWSSPCTPPCAPQISSFSFAFSSSRCPYCPVGSVYCAQHLVCCFPLHSMSPRRLLCRLPMSLPAYLLYFFWISAACVSVSLYSRCVSYQCLVPMFLPPHVSW